MTTYSEIHGRWFWSPALGALDVSEGLIEHDGDTVYRQRHGYWRRLPGGVPADAIPLVPTSEQLMTECHEAEQTLAEALGYREDTTHYSDDPDSPPNVIDVRYDIGDNTITTLAREAARYIETLRDYIQRHQGRGS